jgi:WD40 repeat protein
MRLLTLFLFLTPFAFAGGGENSAIPESYRPLLKGDKIRLTRIWGQPEELVATWTRIAYSRDGKLALIASRNPTEKEADDTLTIYDLDKHAAVRTITLPKLVTTALALSPDAKHALAATFSVTKPGEDVKLLYIELASGKIVHSMDNGKDPMYGLTISAGGDIALSGSNTDGGRAQVWDLKAGKLLHTLPAKGGAVFAVAISPDGSRGLTGGQTGPVKLWDLKNGKELKSIDTKQVVVSAAAFMPDGDRFIAVDQSQEPVLWSIKDNKELRRFKKEPPGTAPTTLTLSSDGKRLLLLRTPYNQLRNLIESFITCFDVDSGKDLWTAPVEQPSPTPLGFREGGKTVLVGGGESCFTELDATTGKEKLLWGGHRGAVIQLAVDPKSGRIWTASQDKTVKCWSPDGGAELFTFKPHDDIVTGLAIVGDKLLTTSNDKTLKIWQLGSDKMVGKMSGHKAGITSLAVSKDGKFALTGSSDRSLKLWNLATGKDVKTITGHSHAVTAVALSADGKWAASGSEDNTVRLWHLPDDGKDVEPIVLNGHTREVTCVAFLPDGKHLLSAGQDQVLRLWNIADEKEVRSFKGHKNWITCLSLSADGKLAATSCDDLTLKLWDVESGKEIASVDLGTAGDVAKCVSLAPDGRALLAGTANWLTLRFETNK